MDATIAEILQKAYGLIRAGREAEAQGLLVPIVRANPNLAEAWYLLGLALTDREKSLYAFKQVIRIDPSNQHALRQIQKLTASPTPAPDPPLFKIPPLPLEQPPVVIPQKPVVAPSPVPIPPSPVEPARRAQPVQQKKVLPQRRDYAPVVIISVVLMVCCVGAGLLLAFNTNFVAQVFPPPTHTRIPIRPTSTPIPTPLPTAYLPVFRPSGCPFTIPLGRRVRCGTVRVPQDRSKNLTELIELPVVVYQSTKPEADAVVFLQGGPGVESIDWSLALFDDFVTPILRDHDMVFFDLRGTGRSKPALECPELNAVFLEAYYQNREQDDAFKDFLAAWNRCHTRFLAEGVNSAAFNTTESAADVRDIVVALGYEQVNLLGISYGTRLGLAVMRDYPEIVRATVLDSVVPLEGKMFNRRASDTQYALNKLFNDCASSPRCSSAYPDLNYVFNDLVESFDKNPATIRVYASTRGELPTAKINGVDLVSAVVAGMHQSELVPVVPKAIYDTHKGDYTFLSYALGGRGSSFNTTGLGTYFSNVCPEQVYVSSPEQLDADLGVGGPLLKQFALTGLFGSAQNLFALCKAWDAKTNNPQDDVPVTANIPTLIVSGQYDPTTPSLTGEMVANSLPNSYFYTIPGMGHGATIGNACASAILMAFLKTPEKEPDSTCIAAKPFEFFLPYDGKEPVDLVEFSDTVRGVEGLAPAGWRKNIADGSYLRRAYLFDVTLVQVTSYEAPKEIVLSELASTFRASGFSGAPQVLDTHQANGLSWTVYTSKFNGEPVMVALAQTPTARRTLVVAMIVSAPERDAYYTGLLIPMLDALVPIR